MTQELSHIPHFEDDDRPDEPPEGFVPYTHKGPFSIRNGPFYYREDPVDGHVRAFRARTRHCNGAKTVHGGCLMSFADEVLGFHVGRATGDAARVTIRFNADFLASPRAGSWVEARCKITDIADGYAYGTVIVSSAGREMLRATGIFKLLGQSAK